MTVTYKVLNTFELVENIVLFLPSREIERAARVCKTWADVILPGSPRIQTIRRTIDTSFQLLAIAQKDGISGHKETDSGFSDFQIIAAARRTPW
jgi:hypothetical protein